MLPPEIVKSGFMTFLLTIIFPESEEKEHGINNFKVVDRKVAYHCSNDHRPPCL